MIVFLGDNAYVTKWLPQEILRIHGKQVIGLERNSAGGIIVSMDIRSDDGRIIVRLSKDGFVVNRNNELLVNRPDKSTLIIEDQYGNVALDARYLNERAFRITGTLHYQGQTIPLQFPAFMHQSLHRAPR